MREWEVFLDEHWKERRFSILIENWNLSHNHHSTSSYSIMFLLLISLDHEVQNWTCVCEYVRVSHFSDNSDSQKIIVSVFVRSL